MVRMMGRHRPQVIGQRVEVLMYDSQNLSGRAVGGGLTMDTERERISWFYVIELDAEHHGWKLDPEGDQQTYVTHLAVHEDNVILVGGDDSRRATDPDLMLP